MTKPVKWKPRASAIGYYMQCLYRAAFDRALHEAAIDLPADVLAEIEAKKASSPYADLGTCTHYHLQAALGSKFPGKTEDYAPTAEQEINAAALFGKDLDRLRTAIRNCATLAARHMPTLPTGMQWLAEVPVRTKHYPGHIDFLCPEAGFIVDLKTTSKPPLHPVIKPAHLAQLLAYVDAIEELNDRPEVPLLHTGIVLYVDASSASWALPIAVDLRSPHMIEYRRLVRECAALCSSAMLYKVAHPSIGPVCDEWCPYTSICRDRYSSPKGEVKRAALPTMKAPVHAPT